MNIKLLSKKNIVNNLNTILDNFHPENAESDFMSETDIYTCYRNFEPLYIWIVETFEKDATGLSNEIRAVLGHLSELDNDADNLKKARGHLRRFGIDLLKNFCNIFDAACYNWFKKYAKYDYKDVDVSYMSEYASLYSKAHQSYINCQIKENKGSNVENNIIVEYHTVAKQYMNLLHLYDNTKRRSKIEQKAFKTFIQKRIYWTLVVILAFFSVISAVISGFVT